MKQASRFATGATPPASSFPIVGIGCSAGSLDALGEFLRNVPAGRGTAFVIVQHLDVQDHYALPPHRAAHGGAPAGHQGGIRTRPARQPAGSRPVVQGTPPFTRLDLLTCRNLLLHFGAQRQKKLLPLFHYAT